MPPRDFAVQEGVILIERDGEPKYMAVKRQGQVEYYRLRLASWQDHVEMHQAHVPKS